MENNTKTKEKMWYQNEDGTLKCFGKVKEYAEDSFHCAQLESSGECNKLLRMECLKRSASRLYPEPLDFEVGTVIEIRRRIEAITQQFGELSTDNRDWDVFCEKFDSICKEIRATWCLVDEYNNQQKVKIAKKAAEELFRNLKFHYVTIDGINFSVKDGNVVLGNCDDIPF